jgi:hypothetical protein
MSQWIEPLERRQHLNGDVLSAARTTDAIVIHGTSASETFVVRRRQSRGGDVQAVA